MKPFFVLLRLAICVVTFLMGSSVHAAPATDSDKRFTDAEVAAIVIDKLRGNADFNLLFRIVLSENPKSFDSTRFYIEFGKTIQTDLPKWKEALTCDYSKTPDEITKCIEARLGLIVGTIEGFTKQCLEAPAYRHGDADKWSGQMARYWQLACLHPQRGVQVLFWEGAKNGAILCRDSAKKQHDPNCLLNQLNEIERALNSKDKAKVLAKISPLPKKAEDFK